MAFKSLIESESIWGQDIKALQSIWAKSHIWPTNRTHRVRIEVGPASNGILS